MANNDLITIENTRFIFETNFSGDASRDRFKSTQRKANLIISENQARDLIEAGFNVRMTKPREGEEEGFMPTYFVSIIVNFESKWPPKIYLVSGDNDPILLDEESIEIIDRISVDNVNVILNPHEWADGVTLYVRTMYVEQGLSDDPFAARYARRRVE